MVKADESKVKTSRADSIKSAEIDQTEKDGPRLKSDDFNGLSEGRSETKSFWDMVGEYRAIKSHVRHKKKHYYFFFDTDALVRSIDKIDWKMEQLYPNNSQPDILLRTPNQTTSDIARYLKSNFFNNAEIIDAEKDAVNKYYIAAGFSRLTNQNILILTDVANEGNSLDGLLNLCEESNCNLNNVKICIMIDRLVGNDLTRITGPENRKRIPKDNIHSIYKIPLPSFTNNSENYCPLCREISILEKHRGNLGHEALKYVDRRLSKIKEKEFIKDDDDKNSNDKVSRGRTLDFLYSKGKTGLVDAILNDVLIDQIYHVLEALPQDYYCKEEVQKWISNQISKATEPKPLRKLLRTALEHNHQALIKNLGHILKQFNDAKRDGFIVYIYNHLICEGKLTLDNFQRHLEKVKLKNNELDNFVSYISLTIIMKIPPEITQRPSFITLYEKEIIKISKTDSNVLLTGETGTGKGVIAQIIHQESPRKNNSFVTINLAAITDTLLESELFGYEKGAFSGADKTKKGKFEYADKGTLFLDEIGEISLLLQVKILNVIQDKKFMRLGGTEIIECDFRLICATNQNLLEKIKGKSFREDLYYRINVHHIEIPPLRNHLEDIDTLTDYFIETYSNKFGMEKIKNKAPVISLMKEYDWPGNVRQLENVIEAAVGLSDNGDIDLKKLIQKIEKLKKELPSTKINSLTDNVEVYEWTLIKEALSDEKGNRTKAAKRLGLSRGNLYDKINKYRYSYD